MIENIASACLGGVIGYLVMYFLTRFDTYTPKVLSSLVSVMIGGALVAFLGKLSTNIKRALSFYVIGLAIGFATGIIFYWIKNGHPPILKSIGI